MGMDEKYMRYEMEAMVADYGRAAFLAMAARVAEAEAPVTRPAGCGATIRMRYGATVCGNEYRGMPMRCDKCDATVQRAHASPAATIE